jgi:hypothetical protein
MCALKKQGLRPGGMMVVNRSFGTIDNLIDGLPQVSPVCT